MLLTVVVIVVFVGWLAVRSSGGTHHRSGIPAAFAGIWSGTVVQSSPSSSYTVSISLTAHSSSGGISFGDDLCSGTLLQSRTGSSTGISFTERLTYNPDNLCRVHETVSLAQPTGSAVVVRLGGPGTAVGTLHRQ